MQPMGVTGIEITYISGALLARLDEECEDRKGSITAVYKYESIIEVDESDALQRFGRVKVEATSFTVSEPTDLIINQRCTVHFYRNVFSVVPKKKRKIVAHVLKAIHSQEDYKSACEKAQSVIEKLRETKLPEAARKVEQGIPETLSYTAFPTENWRKIRTTNVLERLNQEIRRRTRVVGTFLDGNSALMLVCARLRHVAGTAWGTKMYMNMILLFVFAMKA